MLHDGHVAVASAAVGHLAKVARIGRLVGFWREMHRHGLFQQQRLPAAAGRLGRKTRQAAVASRFDGPAFLRIGR